MNHASALCVSSKDLLASSRNNQHKVHFNFSLSVFAVLSAAAAV